MLSSHAASDRHVSDAEILGLEPDEADPVRVILAAQLRLRQCRRGQASNSRSTAAEVRRIIAARDALLQRAVGSLTRLGSGSSMVGRAITAAGSAGATGVRDLGLG